jgi:hypothetical protein
VTIGDASDPGNVDVAVTDAEVEPAPHRIDRAGLATPPADRPDETPPLPPERTRAPVPPH